MTIRPIRDDEIEALSRLTVDVYTTLDGVVLPEEYVAELADVEGRAEEGLVLVAVDDGGAVVGGIAYFDRPGLWAGMESADQVELRMLAVAPQSQGRGVGTGLVAACIDQARIDGMRQVLLHTTAFMTPAQRLYERAGFRRQAERDIILDDGMVLLGYALDLDG